MGKAAERSTLYHEFLRLAGQIERLLNTDPAQTALDQDELVRWQNRYREPEGKTVLYRRNSLLMPGSIPMSDTLREWNTHAREVLRNAPLQPQR
ncbi:hypothetical protein ACIPW9_11415 [Streptomyces sp. NPDC090052]|uniref:hypothetical protein n=1 Tax=unclassified Streptomyces TaxID=2593676 RepID=UPI002E1C48E9|nr:hypothetical protein OG372_15515 [Streptomyces sp. NBC_01020]WSX42944.1 hypothetical protein OG760_15215 [Streptomyces sp. NBC_00963]WSX69044.1 hypothetical protein OG221_21910 [Streptomyces sp. NBC_00932]